MMVERGHASPASPATPAPSEELVGYYSRGSTPEPRLAEHYSATEGGTESSAEPSVEPSAEPSPAPAPPPTPEPARAAPSEKRLLKLAKRLERRLGENDELIRGMQKELIDALPPPAGWRTTRSRSTGCYYYINDDDTVSQYTYPAEGNE